MKSCKSPDHITTNIISYNTIVAVFITVHYKIKNSSNPCHQNHVTQ